jgi:hypothetical protein
MLRIPAAGDRPPPLVMTLRTSVAEDPSPSPESGHHGSRRRTKKSRHTDEHAWDRSSGGHRRSKHGEKRQMFWMLIGGAAMFALIVTGVLLVSRGRDAPVPQVAESADAQAAAPNTPAAAQPAQPQWSEVEFLAVAEPLTRTFLEATRVEDLLPVVRNPGVAEARMRRVYPGGKIEPPGLTKFNTDSTVVRQGTITAVKVLTRAFDEKHLAFVDTPQGIKIDWESWAGWSDMTWSEFLASKPTAVRVFRVNLSPSDYYNFAFAADTKWQAYRLTSPDEGHAVYGYAEHGSAVSAKLPPPTDTQPVALMLALKFPDHATSANQVLIEKVIAEGWVLETESPP